MASNETLAIESPRLSISPVTEVDQEVYEYFQLDRSSCPQVTFLDSPKEAGTSGCPEPEALAAKKPRMTPPRNSSTGTEIPADPPAAVSATRRQTASDSEGEQIEIAPLFANYSSSEIGHLSDHESDRYVGSTLAEALNPPAQYSLLVASDQSSDVATVKTPEEPRVRPLGGSSRALIKEYFGNNEPERLPPGHPVFAFTEEQLGSVLRVIADETARASYDMLENLVCRASRLSLSTKAGANSGKGRTSSRQRSSVDSSRSRRASSITDKGSDTSGVLWSDDNFSSIGYSFEHSEPEHIAAAPRPTQPSSSRNDLGSPMVTFSANSPGIQTLAELKKEAVHDRQQKTRNEKGRYIASSKGTTRAKRGVSRSCKIMKEAYFKGVEWTRTFVSGPVDPRWNKYKFYCQICKANISIYSKEAREILRHHSTEKHLRKDQRWRYEYLYKVDLVTKARYPQVRGKDGKLLSPYQLALELPKFKDVELVDIGEKLPFYEEFMSGADHMSSSSENRARIQISVLGRFLPRYGDIELLRHFWRDVGVIVNHQSLFTDFNWTKERLTVSKHFGYSKCLNSQSFALFQSCSPNDLLE